MLRLAAPSLLLLLPPAVAVAWWMGRRRRRSDARLRLPGASLRLPLGRSPWQRLEAAIPWVRGVVLVLMVGALARPQAGSTLETISTYGVDIVVALDVSGSMRAEDFQPNRLGGAKRTVERFVGGRPSDRIGLVVFAELATLRCPLTQDHEMLLQFVDGVDFAPENQSGTALGMGLASAVNRLRDSDARSRVAVLVTDGRNNRGQIGPQAAAEAARALGIRVYTVGVGTEGAAPTPVFRGALGWQRVAVPLDLDEDLLREIARTTNGRYFRAMDAEGLGAVFETIDALEQTEIESRIRVLYTELFPWLLLPALGLLMLERTLVGTRLRRIP